MVRAMKEPPPTRASEPWRRGRPRVPRRVTAESLRRAALHYLDRYASSQENLRRVLMRKVARSVRAHGTDPAAAAGWIEAVIAELGRNGLLDDAAYAQARARSLRRRGSSERRIRAALRQKGVARAQVDRAIATVTAPGAELAAACNYAQRRRLGPFRPAAERAGRRDRDLAALARAGFDLALALRIIDAASAEAFEELLAAP